MLMIQMILAVVGFVILVCLVALLENYCLSVNESFFRMLMAPVAVGETSLLRFWSGIRGFYREQFADKNGELNLRNVFFEILGSILYTFAFLLFIYAEFHLICLTFSGMGIESSHLKPPLGAGTLTVLALISAFFFFGTVFLDLIGMTSIAPWRKKLSGVWIYIMYFIVISSMILALLTSTLAGAWRGYSLAEVKIPTQTSALDNLSLSQGGLISSSRSPSLGKMKVDAPPAEEKNLDWIPLFINIAIPIVLSIGAVLGGWALVSLLKFTVLGAMFICLIPSGILLIILAYTDRLLERVYEVTIRFIQLIASLGRRILSIFGYTPPDEHPRQYPYAQNSEQQNHTNGEHVGADHQDGDEDADKDDQNRDGWNPYQR